MAPHPISELYDEMYTLYREGRYTREDFERLWPQMVEIARKNNDWDLLSTVRLLTPQEWLRDAWQKALAESRAAEKNPV